jgi:hypothetical protein
MAEKCLKICDSVLQNVKIIWRSLGGLTMLKRLGQSLNVRFTR